MYHALHTQRRNFCTLSFETWSYFTVRIAGSVWGLSRACAPRKLLPYSHSTLYPVYAHIEPSLFDASQRSPDIELTRGTGLGCVNSRSPISNKIVAVRIGPTDSFFNQTKVLPSLSIAVRLQGAENKVATSAAAGARRRILIAEYGTG